MKAFDTPARKLLVAVALAVGLGGAALADPGMGPGCGPGPGPGPGYGAGPGRGDPAQHWAMMQQHREQRFATLKADLKLRPDQEAAWNAFQAAAQDHRMTPEEMKAQRDRMQGLNAVERHQARVTFMEERLADMKTMGSALETFYATLDPQQKATLDRFSDMPRHGAWRRTEPPAPPGVPAPAAPPPVPAPQN